MASSTEIAHDFPPFICVYTDGRVERFTAIPHLPPFTDPITGVQSKDVVISQDSHITSRIFLPKINHAHADNPPQKLPLIIYIHGGAFCTGSPLNIYTQRFLTPLVSQTPALAIAIGYRLAPEHPLPAAFDDCLAAFKWIAFHVSRAGTEPWINAYVDTNRVFLAGESAGATLAHYLAVEAGINNTGLSLRGLMILHPFFTQEVPDELTKYLYPGSSGSDDDTKLNPRYDPDLVLVMVAENDYLRPRGVEYYETLKSSKWDGMIELVENEDEDHIFYLLNPSRQTAKALFQLLISFINQD